MTKQAHSRTRQPSPKVSSRQGPSLGRSPHDAFTGLSVAVLEDDTDLRDGVLVPELNDLGFRASGFGCADELAKALASTSFDYVVLDIGLPDSDGFTVASKLRKKFTNRIGIVVLTGRSAVEDQIKGLSEAADAWLVKPVEIDMLVATLRSLARRMQTKAEAQWRLSNDGWSLHAPDGRGVGLNDAERRLMLRLFDASGRLVTHDALIGEITRSLEIVDQHGLEMLIHRLRRKVLAEFGRPLPLQSVRARGYVMMVDEISGPDQ